ncbi:hypothetical protein [Dokdonia sp. R86516]|uniref:hypothetical protein n=1 Tax=Dokdonia sp. R86516 TaxID=3093856 RepID=UPI0037C6F834
MKKLNLIYLVLIGLLIFTSCSSDDSDLENTNESTIEVTINGTDYSFNTFTVVKHFEGTANDDEFPDYFTVEARINNQSDIIVDFDVELGYTGDSFDGTIIGEFNLRTNSNSNTCDYFGVNIDHPMINVTVNNEDEFIATFSFTNNYGGGCGNDSIFGDEVSYTNGSIYIDL